MSRCCAERLWRGFTPCTRAVPWTQQGQKSLHPFSGTGNLYVASNVPVKQSNMHTYFCRERMCFCELGAAQRHAEIPLQRKIAFLRIGCPHCGPRAGRWNTASRMPWHPGKTIKKEAARERILSAALFFVFIAPVGSLSVSPINMRKNIC